MVWAALTFTTRLPKPIDQACVMQVVRVSGTIKKSEEEAIRRARLHIRRAQRLSIGGSAGVAKDAVCLLYTSPSPRVGLLSRMPSSA